MSEAILCYDLISLRSISISTKAFGTENSILHKILVDTINKDFLGHTNTFERPKNEITELLKETFEECSESNWDGEGALPVKKEAFFEALRFIDNLPTTIPMPTNISADSNGYITMEWRKRKGLIFDISFTGNNEIIYAGILGTSKPRGIVYFGTSMPKEIIDKIQDIGI